MLTPQNFRDKTFERALFGGYEMASVDNFLDEAATDYAAVAKENMVLKSKMKVLVEKIEEYRATEDTMRLTLLSAQKLSLQIEQEAKQKAEEILSKSREEAERTTRDAYTQRATEEAKLLEAKRVSTQYIENMRLISTKQLNFLDSLENMKLENITPPKPQTDNVAETVRSIETSVERSSDIKTSDKDIGRVVVDHTDALKAETEEPTRMFSSNLNTSQPGQISMDNLRFGK